METARQASLPGGAHTHLGGQLHQRRHERVQVRQRQLPGRPRQPGEVLHQGAVQQLQALAVLGAQLGSVHHSDAAHEFGQVGGAAPARQLATGEGRGGKGGEGQA